MLTNMGSYMLPPRAVGILCTCWLNDNHTSSPGWMRLAARTVERFAQDVRGSSDDGIHSLTGCRYTPRAQLLLEMGYCPWPKEISWWWRCSSIGGGSDSTLRLESSWATAWISSSSRSILNCWIIRIVLKRSSTFLNTCVTLCPNPCPAASPASRLICCRSRRSCRGSKWRVWRPNLIAFFIQRSSSETSRVLIAGLIHLPADSTSHLICPSCVIRTFCENVGKLETEWDLRSRSPFDRTRLA